MKKFFCTALACVLCLVVPFSVTAQEKKSQAKTVKWEIIENDLPIWAFYGCLFSTHDAKYYFLDGENFPEGCFAEGEGQSLFLAMMQSLLNLGEFTTSLLVSYTGADETGGATANELVVSFSDLSPFAELVETYTDKNGEVYALMFISNENIIKVIKEEVISDYKVEHRIANDESGFTEQIIYSSGR